MSEIGDWLAHFEATQRSLHNRVVYWLAVPMVVVGTVGLLWSLPVPAEFYEISPLLNWGSAFLMATAVYYFIISLSLAIGLLPFLLGLAAIQMWLADSMYPAPGVSTALLIAGTLGLGLGRAEGIVALIKDLQLMMIGPMWLLSLIYERLRIPI